MLCCLVVALLGVISLPVTLAIPDKYPVDLTASTFNITLQSLLDKPALVEFYASWCPACRQFAPEYDKVGRFFSAFPPSEGALFVGRVDCATEADLCGLFDLQAYPSVFYGNAKDFVSAKTKELQQLPSSEPRKAKSVVEWVSKVLKQPIIYEEKVAASTTPSTGEVVLAQSNMSVWTEADAEAAVMMQFSIILTQPNLHSDLDKRQALLELLQLVSIAHPSSRCRSSCRSLVAQFPGLWPVSLQVAPMALKKYEICGHGVARPDWVSCKGTLPESRGFTCGLWVLFHTMAARLTHPSGAKAMMGVLRKFTTHFFQCQQCQKHFSAMLSRPEAQQVNTRAELQLWLWRAHNEVNSRLAVIEAKYGRSVSGDPAYPKLQWPTPQLCPSCHAGLHATTKEDYLKLRDADVKWNESEVLAFLERTFGPAAPLGSASLGRKDIQLRYTDSDDEGIPLLGADASILTSHSTHYLLAGILVVGVGVFVYIWYTRRSERRASSAGAKRRSDWQGQW